VIRGEGGNSFPFRFAQVEFDQPGLQLGVREMWRRFFTGAPPRPVAPVKNRRHTVNVTAKRFKQFKALNAVC